MTERVCACGADISHRGNRSTRCVACQKVRRRETSNRASRRYAAANPEKRRENSRRWRQENPEKCLEQVRRYRNANREKVREIQRRWRAANPEKMREILSRYASANKETLRLRQRIRLARVGTKPRRWLRAAFERQGGLCRWCGDPLPDDLSKVHADHWYPVALGGETSPENTAALHAGCNLAKGAIDTSTLEPRVKDDTLPFAPTVVRSVAQGALPSVA